MIGAFAYLVGLSFWNQTLARLRRLKQPKYLVGAVVGAGWFYFYFFRFAFRGRPSNGAPGLTWLTPETMVLFETLGGLLLAVVLGIGWLVPQKRAALTFTEAEIAFLFPAPVSRRALIQFKLLRSQLAILITVLIFTVLFRRGGAHVWITAAGWWLIFSVLSLHFLAASFVRSMLLDRGITHWARRGVVLGLLLMAALVVGLWVYSALPSLEPLDLQRPGEWLQQWRVVLEEGPVPLMLYPFRLVVRPFLCTNAADFLGSLWPVLLILALHYFWVVHANVAFEEASFEASRKLARRIEDLKAGRRRGKGSDAARRDPFRLRATGPVEVAFLWKNLMGAGRYFNGRVLFALAVGLAVALFTLIQSRPAGGWMGVMGLAATILVVWSAVLGPQLFAQDLRQDLRMADHLKSYPLPGWRVVLGQLLAPALILTLLQWLLIPVAVAGLASLDHETGAQPAPLVSLGVAAVVVVPALNLLSLIIPNAAVLLLPAWFLTEKTGPGGIESTGQRMVMLLGQLLVLGLGALPAALAFTTVLLVSRWLVDWWVAAPLAGLAGAVILLGEVALAVGLMGRWFEKLDISQEGAG